MKTPVKTDDSSQLTNANRSNNQDDHLSHLLVAHLEDPWYRTLIQSVKDVINPPKLPPLEVTSKPVDAPELAATWRRSFYENLRSLVRPPRLSPLEVTSKPVPVKDIWGLYGRQKKSFLMSTGFQAAIVAVIFIAGATKPGQKAVAKAVTLFIPVDPAPDITPKKDILKGGGGGGDRSPQWPCLTI
jgi:hypothetical protein